MERQAQASQATTAQAKAAHSIAPSRAFGAQSPRAKTRVLGALALAALVAACGGNKEIPLAGERLDVAAGFEAFGLKTQTPANRSLNAGLGNARSNAEWSHRGGSVSHTLAHPSLSPTPSLIFAAEIGAGDDKRHRITADPVVGGGAIYTMDSRARVTATATNGATLWTADLTKAGENADDASGGGLAFAKDRVYVTTGFGELVALNAASGARIWTQSLESAAQGAPTVAGNVVHVVGANNRAWALDANDGRIRWSLPAAPSTSGIMGGASPAYSSKYVLFPFSSGEVTASFAKSGLPAWTTGVMGRRLGSAYGRITDINADPIIAGPTAYVANTGGSVLALDLETGVIRWSSAEGATGPMTLAGNSLYMVNDQSELVRIESRNGARVWGVKLPFYTSDRARKQKEIFGHFGPLVAGGKVWLASSDGWLRSYAPESGQLIGQFELPGGAASNPVVANGTLYVVTNAGQLLAYR